MLIDLADIFHSLGHTLLKIGCLIKASSLLQSFFIVEILVLCILSVFFEKSFNLFVVIIICFDLIEYFIAKSKVANRWEYVIDGVFSLFSVNMLRYQLAHVILHALQVSQKGLIKRLFGERVKILILL